MVHVAVAAMLAACNLPRPADVPDDGGTDAQVVADASPNSVVGHSVLTHVLLDASAVSSAEDLSAYRVRAFIVDSNAASGYTIVEGEGTKDGVITIENVPAGSTYALELTPPVDVGNPSPTPTFYFTDKHDLDLGYAVLGRPQTVPVKNATPVILNIGNMSPWNAIFYGELWANSFSTNSPHYVWYSDATLNGPTPGATSLAGTTFDWRSSTPELPVANRLEKSMADDLKVEHVQSIALSDQAGYVRSAFRRIVDHAELDGVDLVDGVPTSVTGSFVQVPLSLKQNFEVFFVDAEAALGCPGGSQEEGYQIQHIVNPGVAYGIETAPPLYRIVAGVPPATRALGAVLFKDVTFGNPYPAGWGHMMAVDYNCDRVLALRKNGYVSLPSRLHVTQIPDVSHDFFQVYVKAPTGISIAGSSGTAGGAVPFDDIKGLTLTWASVPMSTQYEVRVFRISMDSDSNTVAALVATLHTTATATLLPNVLISSGNLYAFTVIAHRSPADYSGGALRRGGFPSGSASVSTALFRVGGTCGNGTLESGEDCDDGGDSLNCDADCTTAFCGDGYKNAAAGEVCDSKGREPCDQDCSALKCGDLTWNQVWEECDDGDTADTGNGCSAQCTLNKCGDGSWQTPWEVCDDGNVKSGDGCSPRCQLEQGWTCSCGGGMPCHCQPLT